MKKLTSLIAIHITTLFLVGCTSIPVEQVNERLNAWKGLPVDELVKYWGLPSKKNQVDNQNYAEWLNKNNEPGNTSFSIGTGHHGRNTGIGIGLSLFGLGGTNDACSRLVTYSNKGIVMEISWQGTQNFCYEITPERKKIEANRNAKQSN